MSVPIRKPSPQTVQEPAHTEDDQIIAWIRDPDTADRGFRALLVKYQKRLYWHVRRLVIEHEDTNDVVQECLVKVYRKIGSFRKDSGLYTWLYRIATNEALSFLRKQKRKATRSIDDEELLLAEQLKADAYFDGDAAQIRLQRAVAQLPDKQRAVFNLRYFEEMSYRDMSEVLSTSIGALKASYHHAVKKIEKSMVAVEPK